MNIWLLKNLSMESKINLLQKFTQQYSYWEELYLYHSLFWEFIEQYPSYYSYDCVSNCILGCNYHNSTFQRNKNNIIEIANEWYYLVLVSLLSYFNSPDRWSEIIESVYLYIIIANSLTIISVIISKSKHEFNFS